MGDGEELYYHDMVAAVVVKAKEETVLPLNPEFIRNEDGKEKSYPVGVHGLPDLYGYMGD
jgi:hypothetical protein